ncbi:hybrid-cluster NAD(P)-dependent oxidoreductase [Nocardioides sp. CFH 31398]|uniref:hybrid-cluster NAD(P)-dependent oxidoreductase n=1 Tax=Nocardioides sp. CFH 31398 TaxID=2919579 RepID=UPI001F06A599|nr:hybrid-cluster NAD(P)-dependent oxidoreductase [Nocardioides sp. CFH 31398]MCH1866230.1 hybrid-cluster NAD(P)-dependent oxidoreductase [Nocardioides sp. CFH 31398]
MSGFDADLRVRRVVPVTHDVTTFVLEAPAGWDGRFDAGQHLTVTVPLDGPWGRGPVERCYTISSPPTRPETLAITVKRQPGGVVSGWLHEVLRPGDTLRARGPAGAFSYVEHPASSYLFLVAGSGITPAMSMLRALADRGSDASVVLVNSARTPSDLVFRRELAALSETGLDLRVTSVCEADSLGDRWDGPLGRLSASLLALAVPDLVEREVFLCGPPGYMAAATALLDGLGAEPERVHRESFEVGSAEALFATAEPADGTEAAVRVELKRTGRTVVCAPGETVLDAVTTAGVMLRSSCRQGICGTCKLSMVEGEVDMRHQGGIRQREIDGGRILPCCSRPLTDLVLDV